MIVHIVTQRRETSVCTKFDIYVLIEQFENHTNKLVPNSVSQITIQFRESKWYSINPFQLIF